METKQILSFTLTVKMRTLTVKKRRVKLMTLTVKLWRVRPRTLRVNLLI